MKELFLWLALAVIATQNSQALTLPECLQKALAQNRLLQAGRERIEAERSKAGQTRSAFYPSLTFSASYTRLSNVPGAFIPAFPPLLTSPREITFGFKDNYLSRLSLSAPIFSWGKISGPYQIQKKQVMAESLKLVRSEEEVKLSVSELFWSALSLEKNLEARKKSSESLEKHLKTVENKLAFGQATNFEQLRAKVELTNSRVPIKETEAQLKTVYDRLGHLMGMLPDESFKLDGELDFTPVSISLSDAVAKAKQNRTELKEMNIQKQILERSQALAAAENRPSLFLISNAEVKNPFNAQKIWKFDWNAGAGIIFPLFSGFHSRYKVEEIEYQKKALDLSRKESEAQIELEVRQAFYDLEVAAENSASLKENIALAQKALEIARVQYEAGVATNLEELDAELAAQTTQTAYSTAVSSYLIAQARLEKALGAPIQ